eukprot:CAMPEP_0171543530 /NCGR_PEP_ID=MMETSP0960-20121227/2984_1 /TAXON_ID=87120 /ORGANISM="Aurantiochytrium limacinum, Strain ATCCMYA-1381" /LENGTH=830 /DNA_ID=CAMNT_0012091213 /DNA_START=307 /DNA_END=2799 /DNA_ORIENTATION=-
MNTNSASSTSATSASTLGASATVESSSDNSNGSRGNRNDVPVTQTLSSSSSGSQDSSQSSRNNSALGSNNSSETETSEELDRGQGTFVTNQSPQILPQALGQGRDESTIRSVENLSELTYDSSQREAGMGSLTQIREVGVAQEARTTVGAHPQLDSYRMTTSSEPSTAVGATRALPDVGTSAAAAIASGTNTTSTLYSNQPLHYNQQQQQQHPNLNQHTPQQQQQHQQQQQQQQQQQYQTHQPQAPLQPHLHQNDRPQATVDAGAPAPMPPPPPPAIGHVPLFRLTLPPSTTATIRFLPNSNSNTDTGAGPEHVESSNTSTESNGILSRRSWRRLSCVGDTPGPRSGAASVVLDSKLYVFGGYGGEKRLDDFYEYCFNSRIWRKVELVDPQGPAPGPRENNGFVTFGKCLYLFGGYNGLNWLNDTWEFNTLTRRWRMINATGAVPSHRFGFVSVTYENRLFLFGGYNGTSWLNDMYALDLTTERWSQLDTSNVVPSRRSCPAWVQRRHSIYMFGGYDGVERKNDLWEYRIRENKWVEIKTAESCYKPIGRYFHACGIHGDLFYVFGGYQGAQRLNDMHQFSFTTRSWRQMKTTGDVPSGRSSLVAHVHNNSFFVFGGYNGRFVLNDFFEYPFLSINVEPPKLLSDLSKLIDHEQFSDVTFMVENRPIRAVRALLAARSEHFRALLFGGMREDAATIIELPDIQYEVFRAVIEYLYTDSVDITSELAVPLLIASERYILPRLKSLCEESIFKSISPSNCVHILLQAYMYNAESLKTICLDFIVDNIVALRSTPEFQELRQEPDLLMEIIMRSAGSFPASAPDSESAAAGLM